MQDREFYDLVDETFEQLEDELDELDADLDIDTSGGILSIKLPNGSAVIFSRQVANHELWIAAQSGGFHLRHIEGQWYCETSRESLQALVDRVFSDQLGFAVSLLNP